MWATTASRRFLVHHHRSDRGHTPLPWASPTNTPAARPRSSPAPRTHLRDVGQSSTENSEDVSSQPPPARSTAASQAPAATNPPPRPSANSGLHTVVRTVSAIVAGVLVTKAPTLAGVPGYLTCGFARVATLRREQGVVGSQTRLALKARNGGIILDEPSARNTRWNYREPGMSAGWSGLLSDGGNGPVYARSWVSKWSCSLRSVLPIDTSHVVVGSCPDSGNNPLWPRAGSRQGACSSGGSACQPWM